MKRLTLASLFSLFSAALFAQTPYLVKDVNTTAAIGSRASSPYDFFAFGSRVYFAAAPLGLGPPFRLYATDGTANGTAPVGNATVANDYAVPLNFAVINGKLVFNGRDSHGDELWVTDGTSAGTRLLADINPSNSSAPGARIAYHGQLIFSADDGINGRELWTTDGTPAGTKFFKDLVPGKTGSSPRSFVILNDVIYFVTDEGLWKSDGTDAGTVKVKSSISVNDITIAGSRMFFIGSANGTGYEPWVSDGTPDGTRMIADLVPGSNGSSYYGGKVTAFGDRIVFAGYDADHGFDTSLWVSDGTAAGTHELRDVAGTSITVTMQSFAVIGGTVYFPARSGPIGDELWKSDGTVAGTSLVSDIVPGFDGSNPRALVALGDKVYFVAYTPATGSTLWVTDGTAGGTHTVTHTPLTVGNELWNAGGVLYFAGANKLNGFEPWKSDGTEAGTAMITNLAVDDAPSSTPDNLTAAGDWLYFEAWDGFDPFVNGVPQSSLWRTDGTPQGTLKLTAKRGTPYYAAGHSLLFNDNGVFGNSPVWQSDGTPEGTAEAKEFALRFPSPQRVDFVNGGVIFASTEFDQWATTLAPGSPAVRLGSPRGSAFADFAGRTMYFTNDQFSNHSALWTSDGTAAGTFAVVPDLGTNQTSFANRFVVGGGFFYFTTVGKLWKSDGTFEGTTVVKQFPTTPEQIVATSKNVFFRVGPELWVSDGTDAGTHTLPATPNGTMVPLGDRLVFKNFASPAPRPWVSDGTASGTRMLRDVGVGTDDITSAEGTVYFPATDAVNGAELWMTDGTPEGTKLAADVVPGIGSSFPKHFVPAGDRLYFTATTAETGNELWALPFAPGSRLTVSDTRAGEGDAVHFTVTLSPASAKSVIVEYATADNTAAAGSDYDAASGTLTFAPGETTKIIEVRTRGDATPENNESFFVTLRNAAGAALARSTAFAVIEDADQLADVAIAVGFNASGDPVVQTTNNGPRTATGLKLQVTQTPYSLFISGTSCQGTCTAPKQLAPGATAAAMTDDGIFPEGQRFVTATMSAHQRDPIASNNTVSWIANRTIAMDAFHLTPGSDAHVGFDTSFINGAAVGVESSNPAVVSVPSSISATPNSFVVHGVSVGSATVRVFTPSYTIGTLLIDVVAPGAQQRWPGGVDLFAVNTIVPYDQPEPIYVYASGSAPFTGKLATGTVTLTSAGHELGRVTLDGTTRRWLVYAYMPEYGSNVVTATYDGDANFLPMTITSSGYAERGRANIAATIYDHGSTATIHVRLIGSPMGAPTGKVYIGETSVTPDVTNTQPLSLTATTPGVAEAEVTLTNLPPGAHTFRVVYPGDGRRYNGSSQEFREVSLRKHTVRH